MSISVAWVGRRMGSSTTGLITSEIFSPLCLHILPEVSKEGGHQGSPSPANQWRGQGGTKSCFKGAKGLLVSLWVAKPLNYVPASRIIHSCQIPAEKGGIGLVLDLVIFFVVVVLCLFAHLEVASSHIVLKIT